MAPDAVFTAPPSSAPPALVRIVAAIDQPACALDAQGRVLFANEGFGAALGRSAEALRGERLDALEPRFAALAADLRAVAAAPGSARRGPAGAWRLSAWEDAGEVRAALCALPLEGAAATEAPSSIGHDDTLPRLRRANEDLQTFAYIASHDLQEPLRTIATCSSMLERRALPRLDDKDREFLAYAIDAAKRMERLIADLLAFSRIGTHDLVVTPVDLALAAAGVLEAHADLIASSGAQVDVGPLPVVRGDAALLGQVLYKLLDNALVYRAEQPPVVRIAAARHGRSWEVTVHDNGIGIAPEFHQRVFGVFKRLHTRSRYPGTGAGLAIVRRIVERHGGEIWVDSLGKGGSTMHFTLPADDAGAAEGAHG